VSKGIGCGLRQLLAEYWRLAVLVCLLTSHLGQSFFSQRSLGQRTLHWGLSQ